MLASSTLATSALRSCMRRPVVIGKSLDCRYCSYSDGLSVLVVVT